MKTLSLDTSTEMQERMFAQLRTVPPGKKLILTFDLIQTTRLIVAAGIRRRFPKADESKLRRHLISKLLPRDAVIRAYGFDPDGTTD